MKPVINLQREDGMFVLRGFKVRLRSSACTSKKEFVAVTFAGVFFQWDS